MSLSKIINLSVRSYVQKMRSHKHHYHQLVLPLQGIIDIDIEGSRENIGVQRCAIISAGKRHSFSADENARFLVADFNELPSNINEQPHCFVTISSPLQDFIYFIEQQLKFEYQPIIETHINELFYQLVAAQKLLPNIDARIINVIDYLNSKLADVISLEKLADVACLSKSQYKVLFKQQMGTTTGQYILALRMTKARALLTHTDTPVAIIAEKVGYQNLPAFSRRFSAYFGQSPRHFTR